MKSGRFQIQTRLILALMLVGSFSFAQTHKGISFQAVIKLPSGESPNKSGLTVNARVLSPNNCILREEQFTGVNISNGYVNITIGTGTVGGNDPGLTIKQVMDNSVVISNGPSQPGGLICLNLDGTTNGAVTSFNPGITNGARKFRLSLTIDSTPIVADFNMRSAAYAINSETLDGKTKADFINVSLLSGLSQANAESIFNRFTKLDSILNNFNASGNGLSANVSGTAANVTGTVAVANGGTGATTAAGARTNLGLAAIASTGSAGDLATGTVPTARLGTGTADGTTYLRGDGTWATVAAGSGDITDVVAGTGLSGGGTSGSVTVNLSDVGTAGDYYKVTTNAQGRVTAGQTSLIAADIPSLPTSKITTGTFADSMLAGLSIDKLISASTKYLNYKPNNVACADNEVLKYDSTLNSSAGGWKCAADSGVGAETDPSVAAYAKNAPGAGLTTSSNVLVVDSGTTANKVVKLDGSARLPAVDGSQLTNLPGAVNFSGSLTGDVTGTQSATVVSKINGVTAATAVSGDDLKYMKYVHGSGWQPQFIKLSELRNATGVSSAFNVGSCTAAQTLVWSSITDQFSCQDITGVPAANITGLGSLAAKSAVTLSTSDVTGTLPIANGGTGATSTSQGFVFAGPASGGAGAPSFRAITASDLPASASYWVAGGGGITYLGGSVGVGVTGAEAKLDVAGAIKIGTDGAACSSTTVGSVKYEATTKTFMTCDGVAWESTGSRGLIPAGSTVSFGGSCPTGWTQAGTMRVGATSTSAVACTNTADAFIPSSASLVMETCPVGWTRNGPFLVGAIPISTTGVTYSYCSPAVDQGLPLGVRLVTNMSSCPDHWAELGISLKAGAGLLICNGCSVTATKVCEAPGRSPVSSILAFNKATTSAAEPLVIQAAPGGSTSGNGGNLLLKSGTATEGAGGAVTLSAGSGATASATAQGGGTVSIVGGGGAGGGAGGFVSVSGGSDPSTTFAPIYLQSGGGRISIGTNTVPTSRVMVNGAITNVVSSFTAAFTCGTSSIDFSAGNFLRLDPSNTISAGSCTVALTNLVAGGSYTLVVAGNAATNAVTYTFSGYTFKYLPANAATTAGKDTIYTFLYDGVNVYVTWAGGY